MTGYLCVVPDFTLFLKVFYVQNQLYFLKSQWVAYLNTMLEISVLLPSLVETFAWVWPEVSSVAPVAMPDTDVTVH